MGTRCTATTIRNQPCRAWAVPGTDPPRCAAHGGASSPPGAPANNQNAVTHAVYASSNQSPADLPAAIAALDHRIRTLSRYIDVQPKLELHDMVILVKLQGELTSRLGRLLKIWSDLNSEDAGELTGAINEALDMISDAWSLPL